MPAGDGFASVLEDAEFFEVEAVAELDLGTALAAHENVGIGFVEAENLFVVGDAAKDLLAHFRLGHLSGALNRKWRDAHSRDGCF